MLIKIIELNIFNFKYYFYLKKQWYFYQNLIKLNIATFSKKNKLITITKRIPLLYNKKSNSIKIQPIKNYFFLRKIRFFKKKIYTSNLFINYSFKKNKLLFKKHRCFFWNLFKNKTRSAKYMSSFFMQLKFVNDSSKKLIIFNSRKHNKTLNLKKKNQYFFLKNRLKYKSTQLNFALNVQLYNDYQTSYQFKKCKTNKIKNNLNFNFNSLNWKYLT